jgi:hypothetical protein
VLARLAPEIERLGSIPWDIPEYHDEQRLSDGDQGFGPVANIYASPHLDGFKHVSQIADQRPPGLLVAVVVVDADAGARLPATYTRLGLRPRVNCLWLAFERGDPGRPWRGRISPSTQNGTCSRSEPTSNLAVERTPVSGFPEHADYPPVGRFSEAEDGQPLLGVKCLNAWCEFGPPNFRPKPPGHPNRSRQGRIKGWHDEQLLAIRTDAGVLVPGVRAALIPDSNLVRRGEGDFLNQWVPVATLYFPADPGPKYSRWGLSKGENLLELTDSAGVWRARITPEGGTPRKWLRVKRTPHDDAIVPGTARFRWTRSDDGVWVPCGQACCRTDGFQIE